MGSRTKNQPAKRVKVEAGAIELSPKKAPPASPDVFRAHTKAPAKAAAKVARRPKTAKSRKPAIRKAKYGVGQVVRHKHYSFRGVVFDIDPVFASTEEWWLSIPAEMRPSKNQPFYHLLAESAETQYIAYVSEQNLMPDNSGDPVRHPQLSEFFVDNGDGTYKAVFMCRH